MTRDEALAIYRPIRAAIRRVLKAAVPVCNHADLTRAAKQLGLWEDGKIVLPDGDAAAEMLSDIALFEPNQRGRRAFDHFLAEQAGQLAAAEMEIARRMGQAFFSLFQCTSRQGLAGVWIEDLLDGNRRLWLVDEGMEKSVPTGEPFGMRLFDAGHFHVGFGIVVPSDEETTQFSVQAKAHGGRLPFRHSLAATLYGDSLCDSAPIAPELAEALEALFSGRSISAGVPHQTRGPRSSSAKARARKTR
ncbi:MAG: hypothetical protein ABSC25_08315 [Roseiarcus sp.]|jgi:hypothetical protein